jgi:hypothetical protein
MNGSRRDEHEPLMRAGDHLRKELTESGKFQLIYFSLVNAAAHDANLQVCGGCNVRFAQRTRGRFFLLRVSCKGLRAHSHHELSETSALTQSSSHPTVHRDA